MIDVNRITLIEKENKRFLRYELSGEETISKTEMEMLKNNQIPNILTISEIQEDDNTVFLYDVTGKAQLVQRLQQIFSCEQLYRMMQSLCKIWTCTDEYMLDRKHFILYPELMCIDWEMSELYVMDFPVSENDDTEIEFHRIVTGIFQQLFYQDHHAPRFYSYLLEYVDHAIHLNVKEFQEFLEQSYRREQGVLSPVSAVPDMPENKKTEDKEIMQDMAKELLQARFQAQNDEVRFLENVGKETEQGNFIPSMGAGNKKKPNVSIGLSKEKKKNVFVPKPVESKKTGVMPVLNKKQETERKKEEKLLKKEQKKAEKERKKTSVPTVPIQVSGNERKVVKETMAKEKKGFFGFGKKKEKKGQGVPTPPVNINSNPVPNDIPTPSMYTSPISTPPVSPMPSGKDIYSGQVYQGQGLMENGGAFAGTGAGQIPEVNYGQQAYRQDIGSQPVHNNSYSTWSLPTSGSSISQQPPKPVVTPPTVPKQTPMDATKTILKDQNLDLDATLLKDQNLNLDATLLKDQNLDLDATILKKTEKIPVSIPILRNKQTGELVKITYSGFLVGRKRKQNAMNQVQVRQPDLILSNQYVGRSHAMFTKEGSQWFVIDQETLNGTFVNGNRLEQKQPYALKERDVIQFACEEYEYEFLIITE